MISIIGVVHWMISIIGVVQNKAEYSSKDIIN